MEIKINGKAETAGVSANLLELVVSRGLCPEKIVVEHNLVVLAKERWQETALRENDTVEIISFVGGG